MLQRVLLSTVSFIMGFRVGSLDDKIRSEVIISNPNYVCQYGADLKS